MASSEALDLLNWEMHVVTYRHITMAIGMARKVLGFVSSLFCLLLPWRPPGQYGASIIVTQWWHPEASSIALDMLHQEMHFALHRPTTMAIKMAGRQGALFPIVDLHLNINVAKVQWYGSLKLKTSYTNVHCYVYYYFVPYWLPPTAMDAISATIVAGRQAQLQNMQSSIEINFFFH